MIEIYCFNMFQQIAVYSDTTGKSSVRYHRSLRVLGQELLLLRRLDPWDYWVRGIIPISPWLVRGIVLKLSEIPKFSWTLPYFTSNYTQTWILRWWITARIRVSWLETRCVFRSVGWFFRMFVGHPCWDLSCDQSGESLRPIPNCDQLTNLSCWWWVDTENFCAQNNWWS